MQFRLLAETLVHLKPTQVYHQIKYRLVKAQYEPFTAPVFDMPDLITAPIPKFKCIEGDKFTFLNLEQRFSGWDFTANGMLWAYNQNYFDWINQNGYPKEDCCKWIDKFIADLSDNKIGLDPYPIALRGINWIKFFCRYKECATKERLDSLYSQVKLLEKKLEYHLLGNHLLEDAYGLFITAIFFGDQQIYRRAARLLKMQLKEQVLADGAHYEQSPMYHCILLDRLMDCVNFAMVTDDKDFAEYLKTVAEKMLGHLESIKWEDGSIPLLNDAAYGIAPTPEQLFNYAHRLGLNWEPIPMKECGYRKMFSERMEAIVDIGNITSTYQPGHTHADIFNYELRINGTPFVVETGISTYDKTPRRQYERSTKAHNCVVVDGKDSSRVWGGFRVGKRAVVTDVKCKTEEGKFELEASHDGFGKLCYRKFVMLDSTFEVEDIYDGEAMSYIHLAENADEKRVNIKGAYKIEIKPWQYSTNYNQFHTGKVMEIHFNGKLRYKIQ